MAQKRGRKVGTKVVYTPNQTQRYQSEYARYMKAIGLVPSVYKDSTGTYIVPSSNADRGYWQIESGRIWVLSTKVAGKDLVFYLNASEIYRIADKVQAFDLALDLPPPDNSGFNETIFTDSTSAGGSVFSSGLTTITMSLVSHSESIDTSGGSFTYSRVSTSEASFNIPSTLDSGAINAYAYGVGVPYPADNSASFSQIYDLPPATQVNWGIVLGGSSTNRWSDGTFLDPGYYKTAASASGKITITAGVYEAQVIATPDPIVFIRHRDKSSDPWAEWASGTGTPDWSKVPGVNSYDGKVWTVNLGTLTPAGGDVTVDLDGSPTVIPQPAYPDTAEVVDAAAVGSFRCNCQDFSRKEAPLPFSRNPSELAAGDWTGSNAGALGDCKHIMAVKLALGQPVGPFNDPPLPPEPKPTKPRKRNGFGGFKGF